MAIVEKAVLGTFRKTIADVVGSSWKGIHVVRSRPASVANPRTAAQMSQRLRWTILIQWARTFNNSWTKPMWDRFARRMSGFNAFVRANRLAWDAAGNIYLNRIIASRGRLKPLESVDVAWDNNGGEFYVNSMANDTLANKSDVLWALIVENLTGNVIFSGSTNIQRGASVDDYFEIDTRHTDEFSAWFSWRSVRGQDVSDSIFFTNQEDTAIIMPTDLQNERFMNLKRITASNVDQTLNCAINAEVDRNKRRFAEEREVRDSHNGYVNEEAYLESNHAAGIQGRSDEIQIPAKKKIRFGLGAALRTTCPERVVTFYNQYVGEVQQN